MPKPPLWTNHDTIRELRAQVACLEAAIERLGAALSDTAGEGAKSPSREAVDRQYREQGWLPPEVREQVKEMMDDFDRWQDEHINANPGNVPACLGRDCPGCKLAREKLRAALGGE